MRTDALLAFVPLGGNLSLVAGSGVSVLAPNIIDLLGLGVGVAPTPDIFGNTTVFGDPDGGGVGGLRPELNITVGTALATGNSATLRVQLQGAPDPGAGSSYTPADGDYVTFGASGAITAAQGAANTVIARLPFLPPFPETMRPRFLRLRFEIPAATAFTAGTIASALVTFVRDDWFNRQAAKNFTVA